MRDFDADLVPRPLVRVRRQADAHGRCDSAWSHDAAVLDVLCGCPALKCKHWWGHGAGDGCVAFSVGGRPRREEKGCYAHGFWRPPLAWVWARFCFFLMAERAQLRKERGVREEERRGRGGEESKKDKGGNLVPA